MHEPTPRSRAHRSASHLTTAAVASALCACASVTPAPTAAPVQQSYEYQDTRDLVALVSDAATLIETSGEAAFSALRVPNSRWRQAERYVFVVDPGGTMLVHPDPSMEGKRELGLKDVNGRPIIRGLIDAATAVPGKPSGWYHYEWPVPGGLLPRWKSSYVRLAAAPSGKRYVVGAGVYNDRMERAFVTDMVSDAVARIERRGDAAFPLLRDPSGPFMVKDAYLFVLEPTGTNLVNAGFPSLENRNLWDVKDTQGKLLIQEMLEVARTRGSGWVSYMWPKPGESVSTQKSTYVSRAKFGRGYVIVGSGVYLADAPRATLTTRKITAPELMQLVRQGADLLARRGAAAFPELRSKGSKWFTDDTYLFVWSMDGTRLFNAATPATEGEQASGAQDVLGRPYGKMLLDAASSSSGEGWVHYMFPLPDGIFPTWKSSFVKRARMPDGQPVLVGSGVYDMQMDRAFVADVVDRASALVAEQGAKAFPALRDRTGPFRFMDTYVFVDAPDGTELVNPAQPSVEGKNLAGIRDVKGRTFVRDYIDAAMRTGAAWVEYYWYKPGENTPMRKLAYVRKVQSGGNTYIVGSGLYVEEAVIGADGRH